MMISFKNFRTSLKQWPKKVFFQNFCSMFIVLFNSSIHVTRIIIQILIFIRFINRFICVIFFFRKNADKFIQLGKKGSENRIVYALLLMYYKQRSLTTMRDVTKQGRNMYNQKFDKFIGERSVGWGGLRWPNKNSFVWNPVSKSDVPSER